ncbi:branched-chain amino acid ABC transporter permease [Bradyrhizobium sp. SYSU BS000235]|uniref:branched-chain amino acid ABC transporter permease n=1 Tax=Bradyrhizobium sp. SYSU BS000235 TaxID=3411332 RepID=UPI003C715F27
MNFFLTIILDGLIQASWLFIVALGLTLVFGVLKILNIAHGSFYALGAYLAATAVTFVAARGLSPVLGFVVMLVSVAVIAALIGLLLERGLLKMFYGRDEVVLLLVTYAVFLMLEDITKLIWGVNPIYANQPYELFGNVEFAGLFYVGYDLALIPMSIAIGLIVWFGLNRTVTGKIVSAVIHNAEMSASMGVRINRVYAIAFAVGVLLAALAGALTAPKISVQPGLSSEVIILSFAIVVIGGLGSVEGAAIGAILVGMARAASVHLLPQAELFMIYLIMAAVLVFKPEGLFRRETARRI